MGLSGVSRFHDCSACWSLQELVLVECFQAASRPIAVQVLSLNELGFENLVKMQAAILVLIASSTGDGDSPDNAAKFYATLR